MRLLIIILSISIFSGTVCRAQGPVPKSGSAVASSQIRVIIPSYAIIDLANNNSRSVAYNTPPSLKEMSRSDAKTHVVANDKWSVDVIRERNYSKDVVLSNAMSLTYMVIYVTSQM